MKGIAAGLIGAAGGVAIVSAASNGVEYSEDLTNSIIDLSYTAAYAVSHEIDKYALIKKYEYSREQEVEADIVALLFLKWMGGKPESYIDLMAQMPNKGDENEEYRTHPTMNFRIKNMKDFIGKPDRIFVVNNIQYNIPEWKSVEFLEKFPHAKELHQEKGKAIKNSHSEKEIDDIYK